MRKIILKHLSKQKLKKMQHKTGLFIAAPTNNTGYGKAAWIRDNIYEALGLEHTKDYAAVIKTYRALLNIFLKHEEKIDWAIKNKPQHKYQYIHARYDPETLNEFWDEWGNMQNDAIGAFLFKIADLMDKNIQVIRDYNDLHIIQKLVLYLQSVEYWHDKDNGMWEENEEVHASSVGACLAGLKNISKYVHVPNHLINKGQEALNSILPRESESKITDLALLSLIYPYNIVNDKQKLQILENIKQYLIRENGAIRYIGDKYYEHNGMEAEWCFVFPWLAKIYKDLGDKENFEYYIKKTHKIMNWKGDIPELYLANGQPNENTPLGWAQAMYLCAVC
ncbi:MAG: glycoside hydrolase family 15 protein [Candidatus Woesearchaeota archaeon]